MSTPMKRRATSVKLRRDHMSVKHVAAAASEHNTITFETVPLINRLHSFPSQSETEDETFRASTTPCRLTSSSTVRERRRCLSAEDPTHRPQQSGMTSRAPAAPTSGDCPRTDMYGVPVYLLFSTTTHHFHETLDSVPSCPHQANK